MPTAANLLSALPAPSTTTDSTAASASATGASSMFGDLLAGLMAPAQTTDAPAGTVAQIDITTINSIIAEPVQEQPAVQDDNAQPQETAPAAAIVPPLLSSLPDAPPARAESAWNEAATLPEPPRQVTLPVDAKEHTYKPIVSDISAPSGDPTAVGGHEIATEAPASDARARDTAPVRATLPEAALAKPTLQEAQAALPELAEPIKTVVQPETPRPTFSLQQAPVETTATPYTPPPTLAAQASLLSQAAVEQLTQVSVAIQKKLSEGTTKFQLELKPADLGRVDVALTITGDGKLSAHLSFDAPITAATFAARESELRQHLNAAGLKLDGDALTFTARPADNQPQPSQPTHQNAVQTALGDQQQGQQARQTPRQAAKALKQADQAATEADLDAALHTLRHRPRATRLALDLTV